MAVVVYLSISLPVGIYLPLPMGEVSRSDGEGIAHYCTRRVPVISARFFPA